MKHNVTLFFKIFILFVLTWSLGLTQGFSADQPQDMEKPKASEKQKGVPKIQFEEDSHDFGKAFQSTSLKHTFSFKNVGTGELHIEKVKAG